MVPPAILRPPPSPPSAALDLGREDDDAISAPLLITLICAACAAQLLLLLLLSSHARAACRRGGRRANGSLGKIARCCCPQPSLPPEIHVQANIPQAKIIELPPPAATSTSMSSTAPHSTGSKGEHENTEGGLVELGGLAAIRGDSPGATA